MRLIPLLPDFTMTAIVDDDDFRLVSQYRWYPIQRGNVFYAKRNVSCGGITTLQLMHRLIIDATEGFMVDHIDGDGLNNMKSNLRLANASQNQANSHAARNSATGFKGVYRDRNRSRFQAALVVQGKKVHLGRFDTAEAAARAYDDAAREHFGPYARLNFPTEFEQDARSYSRKSR